LMGFAVERAPLGVRIKGSIASVPSTTVGYVSGNERAPGPTKDALVVMSGDNILQHSRGNKVIYAFLIM
jgi:hypothetical protein